MAKSDLAQFDGTVTDLGEGGVYKIKLEKNETEVSAKLCGKMRRYNIQVVLGDRVTVGFSPKDLKTGLISQRYRSLYELSSLQFSSSVVVVFPRLDFRLFLGDFYSAWL